MNGARALVRRLEQLGVDVIFGLPGEENLPLVEALGETPIDLIVVRHEQHAAFMAATHGRLTGRPGVCLATLGPGAINLFTGLAHAELGGMPVVALTGQKPARNNTEGSFQVVDVPASARPLIRWATSVNDPRRLVATIDDAFNRASSGRPGAVLVELPEDVLKEELGARPVPPVSDRLPASLLDADGVSRAAALIDDADKPVLLVGGGATDHQTSVAVTRFAERTGLGVVATQLGKGVIPESHPLSMRTLGIHRSDYAHLGIAAADLVVTVGYQPVEHPPLAWNPDETTECIHIGPSHAAIEQGYQPVQQLVGPPSNLLDQLADTVTPRPDDDVRADGRTITALLDEEDAGPPYPPSPLAVVRAVQARLRPEDVVALDNGAYKIWFARQYRCERPNTLLLDNALATMGAGLATGMEAARLGAGTGRRTVAVCGDGGFLMNVQDLETARRLRLDLTIIVLRDDAYGFIGWHQEEQGRPRQDVELDNPDLVALAKAFGVRGQRVTEGHDLDAALAEALADPGVNLIDCPIDYDINEILEADLHQQAIEARPRH